MALPGIVIQARVWAERFPGKVLADLGGETVLQHVIRRCKQVGLPVIVATPDMSLLSLAKEYGAEGFIGDEHNVLKRYVDCAHAFGLESVVRVTADCPFIDPWMIRDHLSLLTDQPFHYAGNVLHRTYPYGLDVEYVQTHVLETILRDTPPTVAKYFEHVTLAIRENPDQFTKISLMNPWGDDTAYDWRLDRREDLPYLRALYKCGANVLYPYVDCIKMHTYAEHLRAFAVDGNPTREPPATHGGDAAKPTDSPHPGTGVAWYERRPRVEAPGS